MVDRIADPWGPRTPYGPGERWPVRVDSFLSDGHTEADVQRWVPTASILHSNGDAMDIAVIDDRIVGVRGRAGDRINHGRVDPKDLYGWQANHSPDRLHRPLIREGGRLVETDCDTAMGRIVARSKELLDGPGGWGHFGFYTSGQLFLEEYYTLGVIGKAGLGTPHMDGNTRLCTATAAAALKASFGTDGQPGSYTDVDHCNAIALWGHNVAETQTVLWMRMLDRRRGPNPPAMLAVDPRATPVAREADLHLALRNGTNIALLNGLLRELIQRGWYDDKYVRAHTIGFDELCKVVEDYPIAKVAEICDLPARQIEQAAELLGHSERLLSTVLQGFYQSNQATAASCQVNNIHLIRGMIGRPGAGIYQMNGQPTAQNNREWGADGDLPGPRNWENEEHVAELARLWNVEVDTIPHWAPPTHAMQIFRYAEQGSIKLLWISATNPAVSLPGLARIRRILANPELFVVAQDLFLTETAELADVVLPAATWGEKTGTFTSVDRTVHISDKAVDPPGEAGPDLDIFLDYARRTDFRDKDGNPLITWTDPESAFRAVPHPDQDRAGHPGRARRARVVGGTQSGRRRPARRGGGTWSGSSRPGPRRHRRSGAPRRSRGPTSRRRSAAPPPRRHRGGSDMHLAHCLGLLHKAQGRLGDAFTEVGEAHREEPDRLHSELFSGTRTGPIGLLRDLQDLYLMASECDICWTVVGQAAYGARDEDLLAVAKSCEQETAVQLKWLRTRMKQAAPQALVVAD